MSEFDDLLNEVLRQDGNPHPPPGLKDRLLAALPDGLSHSPGQTAVWPGVAAILAIGVFGLAAWTLVGARGGQQIASDSMPRAVERPLTPAADAGGSHLSPVYHEGGLSYSLNKSIRSRPASRQQPIRITPIVIEPLVINHIDIAAISPNDPAMKGISK